MNIYETCMKHVYALRMKDYKEEKILAVIYATRRLLRKNLKKYSGLNGY